MQRLHTDPMTNRAKCPDAILRRWRVPLILAALLVALQAVRGRNALEYRRAAVLHGQVWRLLTGSLVHLGWVHLARDLAGLFLIWGLLAHVLEERSWLWALLASAAAVGLGLLADPGIAWYVGISGVLFGLFCAGALGEFRQRPRYAGALLLGMMAVIAWTLHAGALPGEAAGLGGNVVPQAHLYGAIGGAVFTLAHLRVRRRHAKARVNSPSEPHPIAPPPP